PAGIRRSLSRRGPGSGKWAAKTIKKFFTFAWQLITIMARFQVLETFFEAKTHAQAGSKTLLNQLMCL
ncbi:MAG TPA: hypothetical protein PLF23_07400, partial [Candidatus Obscuribacter sp.]|nr:hypothetical protein [Candidatus Obscuribacter sp.]